MARPITQNEYVDYTLIACIREICLEKKIKAREFHALYCGDLTEQTFYRALRHEPVTRGVRVCVEQAVRSLSTDKVQGQTASSR